MHISGGDDRSGGYRKRSIKISDGDQVIMRFREPGQNKGKATREVLAFTLLEVMIALGIFFMAMFTILALVSNSLRNARALQETEVDPGMLAAQLSLTNRITEGEQSGDFGDFYRDYTWDQNNTHITNTLWQVDFVVHHRVGAKPVDT